MAERIVSPGVFTNEVDQSFLPAGVAAIGAAVIGPTQKGPAGIPTTITSYSDFVQTFGGSFSSGSGASENSYKYLTNYSAQEYLKYADTLTVVRILAGAYGPASAAVTSSTALADSFTLTTLSDGEDQNSGLTIYGQNLANNALATGSVNNLRWEVSNVSNTKGTFTLLIRRGDDTSKRKIILEQYNNLTLDPNSNNYIARVIGDQSFTLKDSGTSDPFLQLSGSFVNRSKYVRVSVNRTTYNYLDVNGNVRDGSLSGSLPQAISGTFAGGSDGTVVHPRLFNESISNTNTQGFNLGTAGTANNYKDAIFLLKNQDEYDINLLTLPGLVDNFSNHSTVLSTALTAMEDRSDSFLLIDPVEYGSTIATATAKAEARDSNYAAEYWPWLKIPDVDLGRNVWVPASTLLPSVYAFNDRVAAPWFAPAGLNRGGLDIVVQTERKLTQANRDTLYESSVNPIATFPNTGVVVYGQKTLQKKASALDRVNVRRLLISAKKFVASATKFLVFENNTAATRNRFLSIVNPYFENVQQRQGLFAFKVVMDETNNTPDVIDRNEMRGAIYLQPAKTAEFIIIDFNILPTGASFPE
tara:strand:+ start:929 stop:2683 length:1755 start_codon:yes stop_codon:yes gene_type:complete